MSNRDRPSQAEGERVRAVQLLQVAVAERSRLHDERETAGNMHDDVALDAGLYVADNEVAARERWLKSVDDHDY